MSDKTNGIGPGTASNGGQNERIIHRIPATKTVAYIDDQMFASIVCMIPPGKLSTIEAILDMWAKRHGKDFAESNGGILPYSRKVLFAPRDVQRLDTFQQFLDYPKIDEGDLIPYWRLVSVRGHLIDFGYAHFWTKEKQKEMLEREGHTIVKLNNGDRSYQVTDYKKSLMDLNALIINE